MGALDCLAQTWRAVVIAACFAPVLSLPASAAPSNTVAVTLSWDAPTLNQDGSPLTDLAGYFVHYGLSSSNHSVTVDAGTQTSVTVTGLQRGLVHYFSVSAYDIELIQSPPCPEIAWAHGDLDVDGMQDAWESAWLGGTSQPNGDPDDDMDGDGVCNGDEFVAGSSPADEESYPGLYIEVTNGEPYVVFLALAAAGEGYEGYDRYYAVEQMDADSSPSGIWTPVPACTGVLGAGQTVKHLLPPDLVAISTYFRLVTRLAPP